MHVIKQAAAILFTATGMILASCAEPQKSEITPEIKAAGPLDELSAHFKTQNELPFSVDTTLLFRIVNCDSLGTNEVRQLNKNWFQHDLLSYSGTAYDVSTFYKIDSIKASGTYAAWADSLEPGNTKSSNAYAICKIEADSNTTLLIWALATMSYEACPYSSSQAVYFSLVYRDSVTQTFLLGEYVSAGDPPVSMQRTLSGKMNKDLTFELNVYEEGDEDMDQPEINITREHYEFAIKDGKIGLVKEKKEAPVAVKRKTI